MNTFFDITKFKDRGLSEEYTDDENNNSEISEEKEEEINNEIKINKNNNSVEYSDESQNNENNSSNNSETSNESNKVENKNEFNKRSEITNSANSEKFEENISKNNNFNINIESEDLKIFAEEDNIDISNYDLIKEPATKFPFELDIFQKRSIIRLEQGKSVLVCAHTSSGKTAVAEYGIALGAKHSKRVIYTSPIKALSNQKYQDFKKKFNNVGILTGDVSINPDAQCVIMTTEILQGYLYKNHEILSQLEWIIFDEIHYINDIERGHVWEEILILLPPNINVIMLSATIPNYLEFAKWVGNIKKTTIYIEITLKRIVPLEHQIYIDSQNIFEIKSTEGKILEHNVRKALDYLKGLNINNGGEYVKMNYKTIKANEKQIKNSIKYFFEQKEKYFKKRKELYYDSNGFDFNKFRITKMHHKLFEIVDYLEKKSLCPAVIFVFNIKKITEYTRMLSIKNLLTDSEKSKVINFFDKVIKSKLSKEDQEIPQIQETIEILKSGIGLHHAGLLPILKEIIEILYSQGLIKILFATTSFSIGLNMPTKTVVFTDLYKFNLGKKDILTASEYLQMCGRAGRRGKDLKGNVFILLTDQTSKNEYQEIIKMLNDEGTDVKSQFRLSYKTILSFASIDKKGIQNFVQHSFLESEKSFLMPEKNKELIRLRRNIEQLKFKCNYDINTINKAKKEILEEGKFIYISDNKKNEKDEKDKNQNIDIEDFPCKDYYFLNKQYNECNKNLFSKEKILKKIYKLKTGTILKVKEKNKFHKKLNKGNYVMLIHSYNPNTEDKNKENYKGKLWCIGIKKYIKNSKEDEIYDEQSDDDNEYIFGGIENKENEKQIDEKIFKDENEYKGFSYFYKMYDIEDIINIYEIPYIKPLKEHIIKHEERYYFNHKAIFVSRILKELYLQVKYYFIDKNETPTILDDDYSKYITEASQKNALNLRKNVRVAAKKCLCCKCPLFEQHINNYHTYKESKIKIVELEKEISPERMANYEEFINRKKILIQMKYLNENNNILTPKGKAAREISTTDCVLITEILLSDILQNLKDDELVAFLSSFATNKSQIQENYPKINDNMNKAFEKFFELYRNILELEKKNNFEENIYNRRFIPDAVEAIKSWMNGNSFGEICKMTDLEEGKLYTLISRIYLFFEEIINFYVSLGSDKEGQRLEKIKINILRGIMGVQSLYLQDNINSELYT